MKMSEKSKLRLIFWIRMVLWTCINCVTPVGVFAYKFGLFKHNVQYDALGNVVSGPSVSLNGWGILSCVIVGVFAIGVIKEIADAYTGYSFVKQCYVGVSKVIPLIIAYCICYFLSGAIGHIMYCLAILIICKLISVPLNPLPKWKYEKSGMEDYSDALKLFTNFVKNLKKGGIK